MDHFSLRGQVLARKDPECVAKCDLFACFLIAAADEARRRCETALQHKGSLARHRQDLR
jgi:hypothetical protein